MDFGFVEIFIFACFLAGGGMILGGLYEVYRGICSKSWPSTTGTITQSELVEEAVESRGLYRVWECVWKLKITYTYMVDDKKLQGKLVKREFLFLNTAQRVVNRYPLNSKVKVKMKSR